MTVSPPLNPILMELSGNGSLAGRDRAGAFTATGSGALRYAPAPGARVNLCLNPRAAVNTNLWTIHVGDTLTRIEDSDFSHGTAFEITSTASGSGMTASTMPRLYGYAGPITLSFDAKLVSGANDWRMHKLSRNAAGSLLGSDVAEGWTPTATVQRFSMTWTPEEGAHAVTIRFTRNTSGASVLRISNIVVEQGSVAGPYFDASVWLDPITGQLGTPHASPSVSRAQFWVEEATTNLVTNPWRATNNTGWAALNGSTARSTASAYQGPGSGLLTASAANAEEYISITAAASSHTAQAIVRNNASGSRQCQLTYNGSLIGSPVSVAAGALQTITAPFTGTGGAANLGVRWIDSVNTNTFVTYYLGAEAKAYATSPCPAIDASGTVISGYTWAGTAHASASTRAASAVSLPVAGHIDLNLFTWAARFKQSDRPIPASQRQMIWTDQSGGWPNGAVLYRGSSNGVGFGVTGGVAGAAVPSWELTHNVAVWCDYPTIGIQLDGGTPVEATRTLAFTTSGNVQITAFALNLFAGPFAIYDEVLSDARRALVNAAIDSNGAIDLWTLFEEWEVELEPVDLFDLAAIEATVGVAAELSPVDLLQFQTVASTVGVTAELEPCEWDFAGESVGGIALGVLPLTATVEYS